MRLLQPIVTSVIEYCYQLQQANCYNCLLVSYKNNQDLKVLLKKSKNNYDFAICSCLTTAEKKKITSLHFTCKSIGYPFWLISCFVG